MSQSTAKVSVTAWRNLRIIAAYTGEKQYEVLERVLAEEVKKVTKK